MRRHLRKGQRRARQLSHDFSMEFPVMTGPDTDEETFEKMEENHRRAYQRVEDLSTELCVFEVTYAVSCKNLFDEAVGETQELKNEYTRRFGEFEKRYRRRRGLKASLMFRIEPLTTLIAQHLDDQEVMDLAVILNLNGNWSYLPFRVKEIMLRPQKWYPSTHFPTHKVTQKNSLHLLILSVVGAGVLLYSHHVEELLDMKKPVNQHIKFRGASNLWEIVLDGLRQESSKWIFDKFERLVDHGMSLYQNRRFPPKENLRYCSCCDMNCPSIDLLETHINQLFD